MYTVRCSRTLHHISVYLIFYVYTRRGPARLLTVLETFNDLLIIYEYIMCRGSLGQGVHVGTDTVL